MPRVLVVTGAASGIGLATVEALAADGHAVVGVDVADPPPAAIHPSWVAGDVTSERTWELVQRAVSELDPDGPDGLVSCAADLVVGPFLGTPIEAWRRLYEVNVLGAVRGMQALVPAMVRRGRGAVVAVCSVDSLFADDQLSAYATSKAALLHAVRSAALEHARDGVRINAVCPGSVDTALLRRAVEALRGDASPEDVLSAASGRIPAGRILQPADVVGAIRFLLSEDAAMLSGAALVVDGGLTTSYDFARD